MVEVGCKLGKMVGLTPNARVDVGSGVVSAVSQPAHPVVGRTSDGALEAQFVAKTTQVWDVAKGTAVATLGAGGGATSAVVFSADGKLAASAVTALKAGAAAGSRQAGDWETTVWVWRLPE